MDLIVERNTEQECQTNFDEFGSVITTMLLPIRWMMEWSFFAFLLHPVAKAKEQLEMQIVSNLVGF